MRYATNHLEKKIYGIGNLNVSKLTKPSIHCVNVKYDHIYAMPQKAGHSFLAELNEIDDTRIDLNNMLVCIQLSMGLKNS